MIEFTCFAANHHQTTANAPELVLILLLIQRIYRADFTCFAANHHQTTANAPELVLILLLIQRIYRADFALADKQNQISRFGIQWPSDIEQMNQNCTTGRTLWHDYIGGHVAIQPENEDLSNLCAGNAKLKM